MSEISERAQQLRQAEADSAGEHQARLKSRAEQQELEQQISDRRAREFIGLMQQNNIPTVGFYYSDSRRLAADPKHGQYRERVEMFDRLIGNGWIVRDPLVEYEVGHAGLVLLEDLHAYRWASRRTVTEKEVNWRFQQKTHTHQTSDVVSPGFQFQDVQILAPFADDAGLDILGAAAARYGVV